MARATKKNTLNNSKSKNEIEETKKSLKKEIIKESSRFIVSKKCFERYFTFNENECTLTPKNNPPLELLGGFIEYILRSPRLKEYREKEIGLYSPTRKEYLALIYNKLSHMDYMERKESEKMISREISKLDLIARQLIYDGRYKRELLPNLFSEEEMIKMIKDYIFKDKETIKIDKKVYSRNRKSEWSFLINVFSNCFYSYRKNKDFIGFLKDLSEIDILEHNSIYDPFFGYSSSIALDFEFALDMFNSILNKESGKNPIARCININFSQKKIIIDWDLFDFLEAHEML